MGIKCRIRVRFFDTDNGEMTVEFEKHLDYMPHIGQWIAIPYTRRSELKHCARGKILDIELGFLTRGDWDAAFEVFVNDFPHNIELACFLSSLDNYRVHFVDWRMKDLVREAR